MAEQSLFERMGGESAMMAAVPLFYEKAVTDPDLARFFEHLDLDAQVRKQIGFPSRALGGPREYHGRDLRSAHAGLVPRGLGDRHFDAILRHLGATLGELRVSAARATSGYGSEPTLASSWSTFWTWMCSGSR